MLIGELAHIAGLPTRTVRYYERAGILPEPDRAANGYRIYNDNTLTRLEFIRTSQAAGLTLAEIRSIVDIRDAGQQPCTHVEQLLAAKLADVRERRQQLAAMEAELEALIDRSRRLDPDQCNDGDICQILRPGSER
ncbi:MAG: heavy metal-responsive transcriptional regulator [Ilumatobacteraceae bacterium]